MKEDAPDMMDGVDIEITATQGLPEAERVYIGEWMHRLFGEMDAGIEWASGDWSVTVRIDGVLVSHVNVMDRVVRVGQGEVHLGGIGNVATQEAWQGRGLASEAMREAESFMRDELGVDFGLLLCEEELIPFYQRLGWQLVGEPVVVEQPSGKITLPHIVMVIPCRQKDWPAGPIDLCGLPW